MAGSESEVGVPLVARASEFRRRVEGLKSVKKVETEVHDGEFYWKVYPAERMIPADVAHALGQHGLDSFPDEDGLLVPVGGIVFDGDDLETVKQAVRSVEKQEAMDPIEAAKMAEAAMENQDALDDVDVESVSEMLAEIQRIDEVVKLLFFRDGEPIIKEDTDWFVMKLPNYD